MGEIIPMESCWGFHRKNITTPHQDWHFHSLPPPPPPGGFLEKPKYLTLQKDITEDFI